MKHITYNDQESIDHIISAIETLRTDAKLSVNALAIEAMLSENTLKYILKKKSCPTVPVLIRICSVFDLSLWQFFLIVDCKDKYSQNKAKELLDYFEQLKPKHKDLLLYIAKNLNK